MRYRARCPNCKEEKDINHHCYIQPYVPEEKDASGLRVHEDDEEDFLSAPYEEEDEQAAAAEAEPKPELLVCVVDFECGKNESKTFEEYRVGWRYLGECGYREAGMAEEMLQDVFSRTVLFGQERKAFVFVHNMRGFHSSFILQVFYYLGYKVEKVLSQGAKYLSFECRNVVFRDSLNFF